MLEFRLPDLGEGVTEGEVVEWRVRPGATIRSDEVLVVVGTDKATVEIPSPFTGTVAALLVSEGTVVPVGTPLVRIEDPTGPASTTAATPPATAPAPTAPPPPAGPPAPQGASVPALPAVRRQARRAGLDLARVPGTGPGGRVRAADLLRAGAPGPGSATRERREPLRGARRVAAERLAEAHRHVPQVTYVLDVDFGPAEAAAASGKGVGSPTLLGYVCAATVATLHLHPIFNSRYDEATGEVVYLPVIDLGLAVQAAGGLIVPVLRDAGALTLPDMQVALAELIERARQGHLGAAELTGATFTVSSAGRLGGLLATPLVNWPNVATLGVHAVADRAVVRDGRLAIGRMANLSLSFDHRVIDGMAAAAFLHELADRLRRPTDPGAPPPAA